jgi:hypothetical protein
LRLILAIVAALKKRLQERVPFWRDLSAVLGQRVGLPLPDEASSPLVATSSSNRVLPRPLPPLPASSSGSPPPPDLTVAPLTTSAALREASLVSALFATPQSLVAAFIVSEVLAKPVALRDE